MGLLETREADREGLSEEMTTEQRRRGEGCSGKSQLCADLRGALWPEGEASAKALRWE